MKITYNLNTIKSSQYRYNVKKIIFHHSQRDTKPIRVPKGQANTLDSISISY